MKKLTKYESEDGILFNTEEECLKHERTTKAYRKLTDKLDNDLDFGRHGDVDSDGVANWIKDNVSLVKEYIND